MNINIQSVHFKASADLKAHVQDKMRKLFDQNGQIIRAEVTLYEDGSGPASQFCEIKLIVPGAPFFSKKGAATYEQAVTGTVATILKNMRRRKKK